MFHPTQYKLFLRSALLLIVLPLLSACASRVETPTFAAGNPPLEASAGFINRYSEQVVKGEVRNVSGVELEDVELIVDFLAANGLLVNVEVVEVPTLAPNETIPFEASHTPHMSGIDVTNYRLRFRVGDSEVAIPGRDRNEARDPNVGTSADDAVSH